MVSTPGREYTDQAVADSFGPPPKHSAYYSDAQSSGSPAPVWSAPTTTAAAAGPKAPARTNTTSSTDKQTTSTQAAGPYRMDTTGLRTDNLPKPPVRRDTGANSQAISSGRAVPKTTIAKVPQGPPPVLPPRETEHPDEYTPPAPPSYETATRHAASADNADTRPGRAAVHVPGTGIGNASNASASQMGHTGQLNELQQRFQRLNAVPTHSETHESDDDYHDDGGPSSTIIANARKRAPPPPPAKKADLHASNASPPPPIPMASKPKPS